ncbi:MAG: hypothetical protein HUJ95_01720 [Bacteroidales bacterium]|nr:hypothetical protein [Bacteroidales bacterium]
MQENNTFIKLTSQRDTLMIGDQVNYGYSLKKVEDGALVVMPVIEVNGISDSLEVIDAWQKDTVKTYKRKDRIFHDIDVKTRFTSFNEGEWLIPAQDFMLVHKEGGVDTLTIESFNVQYAEPQIDTATFKVHPLKEPINYPVTFKETLPWIGLTVLVAGIVALVILFIARRRKREAEELLKEPPHIKALRKVDKFRDKSYWEPSKQKAFYSGVTDALREYIDSRFGIGALEMTTSEIMAALKDENLDKDLKDELKDLFERADFIKFAKHVAADDENKTVVPFAVRFISNTYQQEVTAEAQEEKEAK